MTELEQLREHTISNTQIRVADQIVFMLSNPRELPRTSRWENERLGELMWDWTNYQNHEGIKRKITKNFLTTKSVLAADSSKIKVKKIREHAWVRNDTRKKLRQLKDKGLLTALNVAKLLNEYCIIVICTAEEAAQLDKTKIDGVSLRSNMPPNHDNKTKLARWIEAGLYSEIVLSDGTPLSEVVGDTITFDNGSKITLTV